MAFPRIPRFAPLLALLLLPIAAGCGSSIDEIGEPTPTDGGSDGGNDGVSGDTGVDPDTGTDEDTGTPVDTGKPPPDTGTPDTFVDPDTGPVDTGVIDTGTPDATPKDCSTVALATDPASSLDALSDGPLKVGHVTVTVPSLDTLTSVKVLIHYPAKSDGVTPDPGRHAWVMFHHAVHGPYPGTTYDRYYGIFDRWASHGFVVFSIDGAKIFFPPPPCPSGSVPSGSGCFTYLSWPQQQQVARVMDQAITYFLKEQEKSTFPLQCALDASRVAVSGHSRGGGAAHLVPTTRTDGAKIKGYVGFQPVNPEITSGAPAPPAPVPIYDIPALWLDSGNDGDVTYPITAMCYSHTRDKATHVTILGSKHTYTLDTPYPDQGGAAPTITPDEHKRVCNYYSVPFLRAYVRDATPASTDLDRVAGPGGLSVAGTVSSGDATIRWHLPDSYAYVEKFDETLGTTPTTSSGGSITLSGGMSATSYETYVTSTSGMGATAIAVSRLLRSVRLNWGTTEGAIEIPLPSGATTGKTAVVFETAFLDSPSATSGTHPLYIELTDTTGAKSSLALSTLTPVSWGKRPRRLSGVHIPLSKFTGVDLTKAKAIRFVAKAGTTNHDILVDLLRLE